MLVLGMLYAVREMMMKQGLAVWAVVGLALAWPVHAQQDSGLQASTRAAPPVAAPVSAVPVGTSRTAPQGAQVGAAAAPNPLASLAGLGVDYVIGPNDLMDIEVFGVPDLKRTVRVNSTGLVSLPLVGLVSLGGLTAQQAEEKLAAVYGGKYLQNPQISIFIKEFTTQRVIVEGAVARPGIHPFTGQITLLRTMALVGGGASMARLDEVMVFRKGPDGKMETLTYNIEKIRDGSVPDPVIVAEDVVVVKRDSTRALLKDSLFRDVVDSINPFSVLAPKP